MKIVAINCSPNLEHGSTASILNPFLEGAKESGAEIEIFYSGKMEIQPCKGCTADSYFESPGFCRNNSDDMNSLYPKLRAADVWVFATPTYSTGPSEAFLNFLDRLEPLFQPFNGLGGLDKHFIDSNKVGKVVFISSSKVKNLDHFNDIKKHIKNLTNLFSRQFAGALLRPHAGALTAMPFMGLCCDDIYESSKQAGREIVKNGKIPNELIDLVSRPLDESGKVLNTLKSVLSK